MFKTTEITASLIKHVYTSIGHFLTGAFSAESFSGPIETSLSIQKEFNAGYIDYLLLVEISELLLITNGSVLINEN